MTDVKDLKDSKKREVILNHDETKCEELDGIPIDTYAGKCVLALRNKIRGVFGDSGFLLLQLMDIVRFILLHDKFASKGFIITEDTREETYVKIIEEGDESLIDDLESYINLQEKMSKLSDEAYEYSKVISELKDVIDYNDIEECNSIVRDFLVK